MGGLDGRFSGMEYDSHLTSTVPYCTTYSGARTAKSSLAQQYSTERFATEAQAYAGEIRSSEGLFSYRKHGTQTLSLMATYSCVSQHSRRPSCATSEIGGGYGMMKMLH